MVCLLIIVCGIFAISQMNRGLVPPWKFSRITVTTILPGATPLDVEQLISFPLEKRLNNLQNKIRISSRSNAGVSSISIDFKSGTNMSEALEEAKEVVDLAKSVLPNSVLSIEVKQEKMRNEFQESLYLKNANSKSIEDRKWTAGLIERLKRVPGIAEVNSPYLKEHIFLEFDLYKLKKLGLSLSSVQRKVKEFFSFQALGELKIDSQRIFVKMASTSGDKLTSLGSVVIRSNRSGKKIFLKDVAEISLKTKEPAQVSFVDGKPALYINLRKTMESDSIHLDKKVAKIVDEYKEKYITHIVPVSEFKGSSFIKNEIDILMYNGLIGLLLVCLVLTLFMNFRLALCTMLGLPVVYAGTFFVLYLLGVKIDLVSILGMILVIGILVDDAIIVTEKFKQLTELGLTGYEAAEKAVKSLMLPITGTILTTIVAFSPLILIKSFVSEMLIAIPLVIIFSLLWSWLECFFILPNHLVHYGTKGDGDKINTPDANKEGFFFKIKHLYSKYVFKSLRYRYLILVVVIGLSIISVFLIKNIKTNFNFWLSPVQVRVIAKVKHSKSKLESQKKILPLYNKIKKITSHHVKSLSLRVGGFWNQGVNYEGDQFIQLTAYLKDGMIKKDKKTVKKIITNELEKFNLSGFEYVKVRDHRYNHNDKSQDNLTVKVFSSAKNSSEKILPDLVSKLKSIDELDWSLYEEKRKIKQWVFYPNLNKITNLGLTTFEVADGIRAYMEPQRFSVVQYLGEEKELISRVKMAGISLFDPKKILIPTKNYHIVSSDELGQWRKEFVDKEISHLNTFRINKFDIPLIEGVKKQDIVKKAEVLVNKISQKYPESLISVTGESVEEAESKNWILKSLGLCLFLIFFILTLIFKSFIQPVIIASSLLFGFFGVVFIFYIGNLTLGLFAIIGLIGTIGVAVNDSIIMVDQINAQINSKIKSLISKTKISTFEIKKCISSGAASRLRAIVMTSITTLGGLFPMAYGIGGTSQLTQPLALAMAWGILFSTVLTLICLPSLVMIVRDLQSISFNNQSKRQLKKLYKNNKTSNKDIKPFKEASL